MLQQVTHFPVRKDQVLVSEVASRNVEARDKVVGRLWLHPQNDGKRETLSGHGGNRREVGVRGVGKEEGMEQEGGKGEGSEDSS